MTNLDDAQWVLSQTTVAIGGNIIINVHFESKQGCLVFESRDIEESGDKYVLTIKWHRRIALVLHHEIRIIITCMVTNFLELIITRNSVI